VAEATDISPFGVVVGDLAAAAEALTTAHQWTPTAAGWARRRPGRHDLVAGGGAGSSTDAVGPDQWLASHVGEFPAGDTASIVERDGTTTPITGVVRSVGGLSVAGPRTALVSSSSGFGQSASASATPYVWETGVSRALPIVASFWFGPACVSAG
jgi:hypothetical protein